MSEIVDKASKPDGSLHFIGSSYVGWELGDEKIVLDGHFTLQELEWLVERMQVGMAVSKGRELLDGKA
jgi:hypothetical protein